MTEWDKIWKGGDARWAMWTSKDADWIRRVKVEGDKLQSERHALLLEVVELRPIFETQKERLEAIREAVKRRNEATVWDYQKTLDTIRAVLGG